MSQIREALEMCVAALGELDDHLELTTDQLSAMCHGRAALAEPQAQPAEPTPSQSAALEALDALDRNSSWPLDGPRKALLRGFVSSQPADQSAAVAEGWLDLDHATLTKLSVAWGYTLEETHDYVEILRDTIAAAPKP